ncbi:MAG: hypothetical protein HKN79_05700 [Flavobacteriales bacterium]|nr:hypothetical protein [Flavobacteriales bacterium]
MARQSTAYVLIIFSALLFSCGGGGTEGESSDDLTTFDAEKHADSDVIKLDGELFSIPSPMQSAIFLKENGTGFREELLISPSNLDSYQTGAQKAVALGVFGAELGYVSMYEENDKALSYMNAARKIADDIGISGAFSERLIERFSDNVGMPDSMVVLVSDIYEAADAYLKGNERNDVAAMVLFGGWIESLHLTCKEAEAGSETIMKRVAEQKSGFERLVRMMSKYSENTFMQDLQSDIDDLSKAYAEVESSYIFKQPEVNLAEQKTVLKGEVLHQMDTETLNAIIASTEAIRNQITGTK